MRTSQEINELATALAAAQGEIDPAPKDSVNPHFKSRYADLAACWQAARGALAKHGLLVTQSLLTEIETAKVGVITRLAHKSGQWIESEVWCKARTPFAQDVGAASTYLRRYGFSALVGVVADEDDDGDKASPPDRRQAANGHPANRPNGQRAPANQPDPNEPYDHDAPAHKRVLADVFKTELGVSKLSDEHVAMIRKCSAALDAENVPLGGVVDAVREWGRITNWGREAEQ